MQFVYRLTARKSATEHRQGSSRVDTLRGVAVFTLAAALTGAVGCGGKPFNVKPRPDRVPNQYHASGEVAGVGVRAEAVTDEDYLYETFDANLIEAGVYPVRVMVTNNGAEALELKRPRFEIRSGADRRFPAMNPRRAYKRLISYYEISVYSKDGYKRSLTDFTEHALNAGSPLEPGESRQGMLFFPVPAEIARDGGLTLVAARLNRGRSESGLELKLN